MTSPTSERWYTLNLYPTNKTTLLNGKQNSTFIEDHLPVIHQIMCQAVKDQNLGSVASLNEILGSQLQNVLDERTCVNDVHYTPNRPSAQRTSVLNKPPEPPGREGRRKEENVTCLRCKPPTKSRGAYCEAGSHWIHYFFNKLTELDDLLNIDNPYFEQMVGQIYPTELQLNKANSSDTEAPFLDLNLSITIGIVSSKIYDKQDDFNFGIVNFPFLDGDVPRSPSYGVYISQLIRFARVCSNVDDFNNRNLFLIAIKLLKQGYRYHKIQKAFSKFYHRYSELIVKYNIGLKTLLQQGISEPIFYGDLVYKYKRIAGKPNFSEQFKKIVKRYIRVGYNLDIMRQSACLVLTQSWLKAMVSP